MQALPSAVPGQADRGNIAEKALLAAQDQAEEGQADEVDARSAAAKFSGSMHGTARGVGVSKAPATAHFVSR